MSALGVPGHDALPQHRGSQKWLFTCIPLPPPPLPVPAGLLRSLCWKGTVLHCQAGQRCCLRARGPAAGPVLAAGPGRGTALSPPWAADLPSVPRPHQRSKLPGACASDCPTAQDLVFMLFQGSAPSVTVHLSVPLQPPLRRHFDGKLMAVVMATAAGQDWGGHCPPGLRCPRPAQSTRTPRGHQRGYTGHEPMCFPTGQASLSSLQSQRAIRGLSAAGARRKPS